MASFFLISDMCRHIPSSTLQNSIVQYSIMYCIVVLHSSTLSCITGESSTIYNWKFLIIILNCILVLADLSFRNETYFYFIIWRYFFNSCHNEINYTKIKFCKIMINFSIHYIRFCKRSTKSLYYAFTLIQKSQLWKSRKDFFWHHWNDRDLLSIPLSPEIILKKWRFPHMTTKNYDTGTINEYMSIKNDETISWWNDRNHRNIVTIDIKKN